MDIETSKPENEIYRKLLQGMSEEVHLRCLEKMHSYYGLESPPDQIPIHVRRDLCVEEAVFVPEDYESFLIGWYPGSYISLGIGNLFGENSWRNEAYDELTLEEKLILTEHICVHETVHYLHWSAFHLEFPAKYSNPSNFEWPLEENMLEFVAELGTQTFLEEEQRLEKYLDLMRRTELSGSNLFEIVSTVSSPKRNLLRKISSLRNMNLIQQHIPPKIYRGLNEEYPLTESESKIICKMSY